MSISTSWRDHHEGERIKAPIIIGQYHNTSDSKNLGGTSNENMVKMLTADIVMGLVKLLQTVYKADRQRQEQIY